jgi:hypothetical protein
LDVTKSTKKIIFIVIGVGLVILIGEYLLFRFLGGKLVDDYFKRYAEELRQTQRWQYARFSFAFDKEKATWYWTTGDTAYKDTNEIMFLKKIGYFIHYDSDSIVDWRSRKYEPREDIDEEFGLLDMLDFFGGDGWELVSYTENLEAVRHKSKYKPMVTSIFKRKTYISDEKIIDLIIRQVLNEYNDSL